MVIKVNTTKKSKKSGKWVVEDHINGEKIKKKEIDTIKKQSPIRFIKTVNNPE